MICSGSPDAGSGSCTRAGEPILAFEQVLGLAWTHNHSTAWPLMDLYIESRRHVTVTALSSSDGLDHI